MSETFGRYQLLKKLATGGMGQIYLARQKGPVGFEKLVVVKRILPHLSEDEDFIQMFFDEARIAGQLNHPNIAQIYDLGEVEGTYYIAMEFVHGESLRDLNQRANQDVGGLPVALKCRVLADAAAALDFAHHAKNPSGVPLSLIHRDVSPQNILVGYSGAVKLIDFGVAKATGKISHTLTGAIKGKYAYMSPEQARGEPLDLRSDVFGLGIVFYEVLTSTRLFKRENETATLKAVVGSKITAPSLVVKGIPKQVDAIVLKALARSRSERFQTAGEFQAAIEEFLMRGRQASTSSHLAAFMRELYEDEIESDRQASEPTQIGPPPTAPPGRSGSKSQSKRKLPSETAESGKGEKSGRSHSRSKGKVGPAVSMPDAGDLAERLARAADGDVLAGCFFNALLSSVERFAGGAAVAPLREGTVYDDLETYPTADFLKLLWRGAEAVAPACGGADGAFFELGIAGMDAFARSSAGRSIDTGSGAGGMPLSALLKTLGTRLTPGKRRVEKLEAHHAELVYVGDLLPPSFHAGILTQALIRLRHVSAKVGFQAAGEDTVNYRLEW